MTVLILGARGLLGSSLAPCLRAMGDSIVTHARAGAEVSADLNDAEQVSSLLCAVAPDVIVNLAAETNVDQCEREPQRAYLSNVNIVENVASWIATSGKECRLIQLSTDQVYDSKGPHTEDDLTITNYYGLSKLAGELATAGVPRTVLRTNFFGRSRCEGRTSLSDWLATAMQNQDPITVFEDVLFSPLSIATLARFIGLVIRQPKNGVYNLGSRDGMSKADFAFALADTLGLSTANVRRGAVSQLELDAYRPKDMRMNPTAFEEAFDVKMPTLSEEIASMETEYGE